MFESHVVTSVDRTSFDFRFEDFFSNLPLQTFIYCVTDQLVIYRFFFEYLIGTNGLVVKASRRESGDRVRFLMSADRLCRALAILRGAKPVRSLTR